jgi:hypothetical protein
MPVFFLRRNGETINLDEEFPNGCHIEINNIETIIRPLSPEIDVLCFVCGKVLTGLECDECGFKPPIDNSQPSLDDGDLCYDVLPWDVHGLDCECLECALSIPLQTYR